MAAPGDSSCARKLCRAWGLGKKQLLKVIANQQHPLARLRNAAQREHQVIRRINETLRVKLSKRIKPWMDDLDNRQAVVVLGPQRRNQAGPHKRRLADPTPPEQRHICLASTAHAVAALCARDHKIGLFVGPSGASVGYAEPSLEWHHLRPLSTM